MKANGVCQAYSREYTNRNMETGGMDNLNTHVKGSLYKKYPPEIARKIIKKLEFHYTPKRASWLNIAEIELNVLNRPQN